MRWFLFCVLLFSVLIAANSACRESGGIDGYKRAQHDCTKYYQCVHGAWMERSCAHGTVFNERIAVCDHAANVPGCG